MLLRLKARKSDSRKCNNFRESNQKKKQRIDSLNETKKLRAITLQAALEKSPILLSQYLKNE